MAAELIFRHTATGSTLKATIRKQLTTGGKIQMWQTAGTPGWEDLTVANWANYILTMTETPASSYGYVGSWPATLTTVGWYIVDFYDGATIAGTLAGTLLGYWNGATFDLAGSNVLQVAGTDQTAGDIIGAIGNIAITGSPSYIGASSVTFTAYGTEAGTTFALTDTSNGIYHTITDSGAGGSPGGEPANTLDFYYEFLLASGETAVSVDFKGRINSSNDTVLIQAWDWIAGGGAGAWSTVYSLAGTNGTTDTSRSEKLVGKYTGTGANVGKVRIRFYEAVASTATLYVDQLLIGRTITYRTVGYVDGSIWVDTVGGTAGTTPFVHGTADNPVLTWADAKTLSAATGITSFRFMPGSVIALDSTAANYRFIGSALIALAGQSISHALFRDCYTISGDSTGDDATFDNCGIGTASFEHAYFTNCRFKGVITMKTGTTKDWFFLNCSDTTPGGSAAAATFVCVADGQAMFRNWRGGIQIHNHKGTNDTIIDGAGRLVIDVTSTAGDITIRGDFPPATGASTFTTLPNTGVITQTQRFGTDQIMANTADALAAYNTTGVAKEASVGAIATILTGITSLAAWLRGMFRKDAINATALSEINAIHDGGAAGTYLATTDSNEAIADGAIGLTAQQARDAMKLAPTSGTPATGSIDAAIAAVKVSVETRGIGKLIG